MWLKRNKDNTLNMSYCCGFKISISREKFNKLYAHVDTEVEEFVVDVHFEVLNHYNNYLLSLLLKRSKIVVLARDFLGIGKIEWNLTKIRRKMKRIAKSISEKLSFTKSEDEGGEVDNE